MIVTDLEELDKEKDARREKRKREGYGVDSDTDSDDEGGSSAMRTGTSRYDLKKLMKSQTGRQGASSVLQRLQSESNPISKKKSPFQLQ